MKKWIFILIALFATYVLAEQITKGSRNFVIKGDENKIYFHNNDADVKEQPKKNERLVWNLPYFIEHYVERTKLTDMIWEKFSPPHKRNMAILTGLHGLAGVGKTALAINAIHKSKNNYDFRVWFNAETRDLLEADYLELGEEFNLFSKDMSVKLKLNIIKKLLESKKNILLVYDNAPDTEILRDLLPSHGHIIVTSKNYKLQGAIEVDVMTEAEALNLLSKLIPHKLQQTTDYNQQAKKLIHELGYLPLAISQAGCYINENMLTISNYLTLYETNRE